MTGKEEVLKYFCSNILEGMKGELWSISVILSPNKILEWIIKQIPWKHLEKKMMIVKTWLFTKNKSQQAF